MVITSASGLDCGFKSWLGQTKDHKIGLCWNCFSTKHAAIKEQEQRLAGSDQDNVSE